VSQDVRQGEVHLLIAVELWPELGDLIVVVDQVVVDQSGGHGQRSDHLAAAADDLDGVRVVLVQVDGLMRSSIKIDNCLTLESNT